MSDEERCEIEWLLYHLKRQQTIETARLKVENADLRAELRGLERAA